MKPNLKVMNSFRIVMLIGAVWGVLTYVIYNPLIGRTPLPIAIFIGPTILFPGLVGHIIIAIIFGLIYGPHAIHVPNPFTETLGATISTFTGLLVAYILWQQFLK